MAQNPLLMNPMLPGPGAYPVNQFAFYYKPEAGRDHIILELPTGPVSLTMRFFWAREVTEIDLLLCNHGVYLSGRDINLIRSYCQVHVEATKELGWLSGEFILVSCKEPK